MNRLLRLISILLITILVSCNNSNKIKTYYSDGKIEREYTVDENQKRDGIENRYWENGNLKSITQFQHGYLNGSCTIYDSIGQKLATSNYVNDSLNGEFYQYFPNGKLQAQWTMLNDKKTGKFISFYENGNKEYIKKYSNNEIFGSIQFDSLSNSIINFFVNPSKINIPDTVSLSHAPEMTFNVDDYFLQYVSLITTQFYKSREDFYNGKSITPESPLIKKQNKFIFQLPPEIKEGHYFLGFSVKPIIEKKSLGRTAAWQEVTLIK